MQSCKNLRAKIARDCSIAKRAIECCQPFSCYNTKNGSAPRGCYQHLRGASLYSVEDIINGGIALVKNFCSKFSHGGRFRAKSSAHVQMSRFYNARRNRVMRWLFAYSIMIYVICDVGGLRDARGVRRICLSRKFKTEEAGQTLMTCWDRSPSNVMRGGNSQERIRNALLVVRVFDYNERQFVVASLQEPA